MEDNGKLDDLLVAYLNMELDAEQEALVVEWIEKTTQNRIYFQQLKQTSRLIEVEQALNSISPDEEWQHFKNRLAMQAQHERQSSDVEASVIPLPTSSNNTVYRVFKATAVAASILVIAGLSWVFVQQQKLTKQPAVVSTTPPPAAIKFGPRHEFNVGEIPRNITLSDGSKVILDARSDLSFYDPFEKTKRDVNLVGKANFSVAKDKQRPFTVFSGALATTALGTSFTVTAYQNTGKITIRLYEGKVVVRNTKGEAAKLKTDYYLKPGQELVYNTLKGTAFVSRFSNGHNGAKKLEREPEEKPVEDNPSIPLFDKGSWYMFNNQSLVQVFDQLALMYDTQIVYNKKEVQKLYFIGTFYKTDSLESILTQISNSHDLKVTRSGNKYIVSKN